ncbi:MAG: hypothetical protein M3374_04110 [Pseudomonadota bacterium]|nr:hypothetical protein [Pseudomonadota bacterium]
MNTALHDNNHPHGQPPSADDEHVFDLAMRQRYAESLSRLPSNTHAWLRTARHAAALQAPASAGIGAGWKWASAVATVFGLALGLQLFNAPTPIEPAPAASAIAVTDTPYDAESAVAVLDENPDMYLWLAANVDALRPLPEQ